MISIGRVGDGLAGCYLEEEERVDPIKSLAGAEERSLDTSEARGVWPGSGSELLGLHGDLGGADLCAVLASLDPR